MPRRWIRSLFARPAGRRATRRPALRIEGLEDRDLPATLSLSGGTLTYAAGAGVGNSLSVSVSGSDFVFADSGETITTAIAGATGNGTGSVTVPAASVAALVLNLGDGADTIPAAGVTGLAVPLTITQTGTGLTVTGPVTLTGAASLSITTQNALTVAGNVTTATGILTLAANQDGAGTEGFSQTGGLITSTNATTSAATITANTAAGGTGPVSIDNTAIGSGTTGGRLTVNANGGSILYPGGTALTASQQGTANGGSAPGRVLSSRSYVFTATGAGGIGTAARPLQLSDVAAAATITVTASGGDGGVYLVDWGTNAMSVGATATGPGNVRLVTGNGSGHNLVVSGNVSTGSGNIYIGSDDTVTVNTGVTIGGAGFSGTVWMQANRDLGTAGQTFVFNGTAAIVTSNTTSNPALASKDRTQTTQAVYLEIAGDAGTPAVLTVGSITTGDGGLIVVDAAPRLAVGGSPGPESGAVTQVAGAVLNAGPAGTVMLNGVVLPAAGSVTAATWASNVVTITSGAAQGLTVGQSVTVSGVLPAGYNGTFTVTGVTTTTFTYALTTNPGAYSSGGAVTPFNAAVINAIGTPAAPIRVTAGRVIATANLGNIYVTDTIAGTFSAGVTSTVPTSPSTATILGSPTIQFTTLSGVLTVADATSTALPATSLPVPIGIATVSGGSIVLNGADGVVVTGTKGIGGAGTGTVSITGPLSGSSGITATGLVTVTQATDSTYTGTISSVGLTKAGAGNLTLAAAQPYTGATTVSAGTLSTGAGGLTATNGLTVAAAGSFAGVGTIAGPVAVSGELAPAGAGVGALATGNLSFGAGGALLVNLAGAATPGTDYDQVTVTGTVGLSNTGLQIFVGSTPALIQGQVFRVVDNDGSDAVAGAFAVGAVVVAADNPAYIFTVSTTGGTGNDVVLTLATILPPRYLDVIGTTVSYSTAGAINSSVSLGVVSGRYVLSDATGAIGLSTAAVNAGWTVDGPNTVSGPVAGVTAVQFGLSDGADAITALDGGSAAVSVTSVGTLTTSGSLTTTGNLTFNSIPTLTLGGTLSPTGTLAVVDGGTLNLTGTLSPAAAANLAATTITAAAGSLLATPTVTLAATAVGTAANPVRTQTTTLTAAGGAGGAFVTEADGATVTLSATGAGDVSVLNTTDTLTVSSITTAGGDVSVSSSDAVALTGNVNAGAGTITVAANTDGAGAEGFTQTAGTITTTNTTAAAASITVNTAAGGTGDAVLDSTAVGTGATGTLTVRSNAGSILYGSGADLADSLRGLTNGGSSLARTLVARGYVFVATGAGSVGTDGRPIQSKMAIADGTVNVSAGSGGAFWTDWDQPVVLTGAAATGAGTLRVVTANVGGHNLTINGNVSTQTGNILLGADDNIKVGPGVVIGGAGFSGTVWIQANRDQGTAGQLFTMDPTASIVTSNTTNVATTARTPLTQAVYLDISGDQGTPSVLTVGSITTGDGGRVVVNAIPNGIAAEAGVVVMAGAANVLSAGPTGTVELIAGISAAAVADAVGSAALPVRVPGGNVVVASNHGNAFVTSAAAASFAATTTAAVSGQTAAAGTTLTTAAGVLTVSGPTAAVNNGAITLNGAGGVAVAAPLGSVTTGNITINAGGNPATLTSTLTLGPATTLAATAAGGLTVATGGVVAGTGAAANATPVAVQPGGELAPGGTLRLGNTALGTGTLRLDLTSASSFDSLAVTGTANVTGGALALVVGAGLAVNDSFVILSNDGSDAVVGQFADGTSVLGANDPRYVFTLNYAGGDGNDVVATLTQIVTTTFLDITAAGLVTVASADGLNNTFGVTRTAAAYTVTDPAGVIALSPRALAAGWTGGGTNAVTGPTAGVTGLAFTLNTGSDTLAAIDAGPVPLSVNGTGTLAVAGTVASTVGITVTGVTDVTGGAAGQFQAPVVRLTAGNALGTAAQRVRTAAGAVAATAGAGGVFLAEADGADFTVVSGGAVDLLNGTGTLNLAAPVTTSGAAITLTSTAGSVNVGVPLVSGGGSITLSAGDAVTVGANVNAGAGTIAISANTDGAGAQGYDQKGAVLTTTNATAAALRVTVNTAAGGTGNAVIGQGTVGTATGGTVSVAAFGGSILWSDDPSYQSFTASQLGTSNGGSNTQTLKAFAYSFATGPGGSIGTDDRPIQSAASASGATVNLSAGSGGIYWTDWNQPINLTGATAVGAGSIRVVTANVGGHNLTISGNVSTGTGNIYLAADDNIDVLAGVTIGGAGFSGTVWMQANRDQGTANQAFTMAPTASIVTSNTTNVATAARTPLTQAVYLDISGDQGTPSVLTVGNVTTGAGGRVVLNAIPNGIALEAGKVVMAGASNVLTAGTVEVIAGITAAAVADAVGTSALPLAVAGGDVVLAVNHGNTFVTSAGAAGFALSATTVAGQTAAANTVLRTTAGALTIAGPTATLNGGALNLTGAGGVVVSAPLGSATTGAITIAGPLSGAENITLGTGNLSLTQDADSIYAGSIDGPRAVTKAGTGTLTLTGTSTHTGATAVSAGGLLLDGGALAGTSGLAVADVATFGGAGAVGGAAAVSGALAPAGVLGLGGLSFGVAGTRAVTLDLNGTAGFDQLAVTGAVNLTGAALTVNVGFLPLLGTTFTVVSNDGSDPVVGTFAGLAEGATFDVAARTYTISYAGGDGNDVVLTVTHVNAGPPVNTVPASATVPEDGSVTFPGVGVTRVGVDNAVLGDAPVQVTVTAGNGLLTLSTTAGLSFAAGDGTADPTMTFTGTLAAINAALDSLRYDPAADFNGSDTITVTSDDLGATGGPAQTDTDTIPVTVTAVNDVPVFTVGGTHTVAEDASAQTVPGWATGLSAGPTDEAGQTLTFLVTTNNDALFAALPTINSAGRLTYTPAANENGLATITVRLMDGGGTANGGIDTTLPQTFTIVVTPVNDAPVVVTPAGPVEVPSHGPAAVLIAAAGTVNDIDSPVFNTGVLTASVTSGGDAGDVLAIATGGTVAVAGGVVSVGGTPVGTVAGGTGATPLSVTFNTSATVAAVQAVLQQLVFRTPAVGVPPGNRTVSVVVTDGAGGTSTTVTVDVAVLPNVSPTLGGVPAAAAFTENDATLLLAPAGTAGDIDSPTFDDGTLTAALAGGSAGDTLVILPGGGVTIVGSVVSVGGTPVGTVTGGTAGAPLVVTFDATGAADAAAVQAVFRRIGFANTSETIAAGPRTVTFTLTDGDGGTSPSPSTTVTVTAVNDGPALTLPAGPLAATEDVALTITGVSVADLDSGSSDIRVTLTVTGGRVALAGTAGLTVTGNDSALVDLTGPLAAVNLALASLTFTPTAEFNGPASIQVQVDDLGHTPGPAKTANDTLAITVASVNDAPVLTAPAAVTTNEDVSVAVPGITVSDTDAAAGLLRLTLTVGQGTLSVPAGSPAAVGGNNSAAVTLTGTAAQITTTLAGLAYRPANNYFGPDTLTVLVDDQGNTGGPAQTAGTTVPVTVNPVNDAPTFSTNSSLFLAEDAGPQTRPGFASGITAGPANESAQTLTFDTTVTGTTGGLMFTQAPQVAANGTLTFTAATGSNGTATVRVTLTDGGPGAAPDVNATVRVFTITVGGANDAPAFTAGGSQTVAEDAGPQTVPGWAAGISAGPADEAGQALNFLVSTDNPALFSAAPTVSPTGQLTYTPAANANGTATVTVRLRDDGGTDNGGSDTSAPQTFTITVTPVNDAPTAGNDFIDATEDAPALVIDVLANDTFAPDAGETLTVVSVGAATHGTAAFAGGVVTYTPAPNFSGVDSFTYTVSDGNGGTATATVRIVVAAVNDAPTAANDTLTVAEDAPATVVPVTGNDSTAPDVGEVLTVVSFTPAAHGTVTLTGGVLRYAPAANFSGADSFTCTVSDGNGGTATATVNVTVTASNDAPTAAGDTLTVNEDAPATAVDVLANDTFAPDVGEVLTVVAFTPAAHGAVTLAGGVLRYAPAAEYSGSDSFTYTVSDGNGGTATAAVTVTVVPINDPPVAADDSAVIPEDGGSVVVPVLANDTTGPETGEVLAVTAVTQPAHGAAVVVPGGVRYSPAANYSGPDSFTYTVSDGNGGTATATVSVVVSPVTDPPVAVTDAFTLPPGSPTTTLAVLANDGPGPDGGATPRVFAVTQPTAGGVTAAAPGGNGVLFVPAAGFTGTTTFTYSIGDGTPAGTATATVTVTVSAVAGGSAPLGQLGPVRPVVVGGPADGTIVLSGPGTTTGFITGFPTPGGATRTASADVDGDGVADYVLATGPGAPFRVAVLSGLTGMPLVAPFDPFGGGFTGGGFVAAGDVDGDGRAEVVVSPDEGGGPRVSLYGTGPGGSPVLRASFLGIDDGGFRGGARVALGDVDADGTLDVVVAAGFGGGPRAAIFDGTSVLAGSPRRLINDFLAFPGADAQNLRNGAYVAAGDVDGDGHADLVFGGGPGGAPRVFVLSGALVSAGNVSGAQAAPLANFFVGGDAAGRGGARVAVTNSDGDAKADVVVGSGAGRPAQARLYLGATFGGGGEPTAIDLDPLGGAVLTDGVYVG